MRRRGWERIEIGTHVGVEEGTGIEDEREGHRGIKGQRREGTRDREREMEQLEETG